MHINSKLNAKDNLKEVNKYVTYELGCQANIHALETLYRYITLNFLQIAYYS